MILLFQWLLLIFPLFNGFKHYYQSIINKNNINLHKYHNFINIYALKADIPINKQKYNNVSKIQYNNYKAKDSKVIDKSTNIHIKLDNILKKCKLTHNYNELYSFIDNYMINSIEISPIVVGKFINYLGDIKQLGRALALLKAMDVRNFKPNVKHYGALIRVARKLGQWEIAYELFNRMKDFGIERNAIIYNSIITILGEARQGHLISDILNEMIINNYVDEFTFSSVISSYDKCNQWKDCVNIYEYLVNNNKPINLITFNAFLKACNTNREWLLALKTLCSSIDLSIYPDAISFSCVILTLGDTNHFELAYEVFQSTKLYNPVMKCKEILYDICNHNEIVNNIPITIKPVITNRRDIEIKDELVIETLLQLPNSNKSMKQVDELILKSINESISLTPSQLADCILNNLLYDMSSYNILNHKIIAYINSLVDSQMNKQLGNNIDKRYNKSTQDQIVITNKLKDKRIQLDLGIYTAMLIVCERHNKWEYAIELIHEMIYNSINDNSYSNQHVNQYKDIDSYINSHNNCTYNYKFLPDCKSFSSAITTCGNCNKYEEAIYLYHLMNKLNINKDKVIYHCIINIIQSIPNYKDLSVIIKLLNIYTNTDNYTPTRSTISIPSKTYVQINDLTIKLADSINTLQLSMYIYKQGVDEKILNPWKDNLIDLHGYSQFVSVSAIDYIFNNLYHEVLLTMKQHKIVDYDSITSYINLINYQSTLSSGLLTIVTGRGNHINSSGSRGVLKPIIEAHVQSNIQPNGVLKLVYPTNNVGCFCITIESIYLWIGKKLQLDILNLTK